MHNQQWLNRSVKSVWHPCTQMKRHENLPIIPIQSAQGVWLTDFDGNHYLDAVSSWWVNLFGHGNTRIKNAIKQQLDQLEHIILAGFTHQPVIELSERLSKLSGLGHVFYGSDGASATEIALKMSFHYWKNTGSPKKTQFISLENAYHGETVGALGVTDIPLFSSTYAPLIKSGIRVPCPDKRQAQSEETAQDVVTRALIALERVLEEHADTIAAMIIEPLVQGAAGMVMYDPSYVHQAKRLCERYNVHFIADEIAVGFGRTGSLFAFQQADITPDFLCLSKGITGGFLPLSCVLTTDSIYQAFYNDDIRQGFLHSHSYTGNALACRAALEVLNIFEDDNILEANRLKADRFNQILAELQQHRLVKNFRHIGMIWAFEAEIHRPDFSTLFFSLMLEKSCLVRPIGNTVYFMPPYVMEDAEMMKLCDATIQSLEAISAMDEPLLGNGKATALP